MHPLLLTKFPTKLAAASGALWCAWTMAAVLVHGSQNNAAPRATIDPPPSITVMVRTVRIVPELPFAERWQAPAQLCSRCT